MSKNTGHGHVFPRTDGVKARCGGPGMCSECSRDQLLKQSRHDEREAKSCGHACIFGSAKGTLAGSRPCIHRADLPPWAVIAIDGLRERAELAENYIAERWDPKHKNLRDELVMSFEALGKACHERDVARAMLRKHEYSAAAWPCESGSECPECTYSSCSREEHKCEYTEAMGEA